MTYIAEHTSPTPVRRNVSLQSAQASLTTSPSDNSSPNSTEVFSWNSNCAADGDVLLFRRLAKDGGFAPTFGGRGGGGAVYQDEASRTLPKGWRKETRANGVNAYSNNSADNDPAFKVTVKKKKVQVKPHPPKVTESVVKAKVPKPKTEKPKLTPRPKTKPLRFQGPPVLPLRPKGRAPVYGRPSAELLPTPSPSPGPPVPVSQERAYTQKQYDETLNATMSFIRDWTNQGNNADMSLGPFSALELAMDLDNAFSLGHVKASETLSMKVVPSANMQTEKMGDCYKRKIFVRRDFLDMMLNSNSGPAEIAANLFHESGHLRQGVSRFTGFWNETSTNKIYSQGNTALGESLEKFYDSLTSEQKRVYNPHGKNPFGK